MGFLGNGTAVNMMCIRSSHSAEADTIADVQHSVGAGPVGVGRAVTLTFVRSSDSFLCPKHIVCSVSTFLVLEKTTRPFLAHRVLQRSSECC